MKLFTDNDVTPHGAVAGAGSMYADRSELVQSPIPVVQKGDGYGAKLRTGLQINFNGKLHSLYATCYSNAASVWFKINGRTIFVN